MALLALCAQAALGDTAPAVQTLVITATRNPMPALDAPASIGVVTAEQIAERGADNVFEALRGETGVSLQGRTIGGRTVLSLRGTEFRHTLFLVDGKRIGGTDGVVGHSDFQYDWIAAEDIARIEVVRGPMSVLYGSEALGGVVNVITRRPTDRWAFAALTEGRYGDASLGGDGHRAALRASGRVTEGLALAVSLSDTRRQSLATQEDARLTELEGRHKRDGAVSLWWAPTPGHDIEVDHRIGDEQRWADQRERSGARRFFQSLTDIDRRHTSLGWRAAWQGPWQAQSLLRAYESRIDVGNVRNNGVAALRPNDFVDRVLEGQVSVQPAPSRRFIAGAEARDERLANIGLPGGSGRARHDAVYGQGEFDLAPALTLTAGLRHDRHQHFGHAWSPRLYVVWRAAPGWAIKGGVGHGFKAPSLKQISPDYREDEGPNTYFGNATLRPESSDAAEIGVAWEGADGAAQVTAFHSRVTDLIVPRLLRQVGPRGEYLFENLSSARLRGIETGLTWRLPAGFTASGSYTYLEAHDGTGARLEKRPRSSVGLRLGWQSGPWRAGLGAQYTGPQLLASATPGQPLQQAPELTRVAAQVSRALAHGLTLSGGVDNLTRLRLTEASPLFTGAEPPRTWRLALRGNW